MVRPVSTSPTLAPVPADLAQLRRHESQRSLTFYGVASEHQEYAGLPDGMLSAHIGSLELHIGRLVAAHGITELVTAGPDGYDGHPDHIAVHHAALSAARTALRAGLDVRLYALNNLHRGEVKVRGNTARKLGAMAFHVSQTVGSDLLRWGGSDLYTPLIIRGETYDVLSGDLLTDTTRTMASDRAA